MTAQVADLETIEIQLLLDAIYKWYGCDFRDYALPSLRRRIWAAAEAEGVRSISALQARVLHDQSAMERLLDNMSVNVTTMFRDASFYHAFREKVVPLLRAHPFVRIWHAGCATGEEVYSMAILLTEEGLYDRCRLYATDIAEIALKKAKDGIFKLESMQEYTHNYQRAGGTAAFSDYYTANYDHAIFRQSLKRNMVFSHHNLVTDGSFNEFHVILCRNVLIYFNRQLQNRVHGLLFNSLRRFGIFALGMNEIIKGTAHENDYEELDLKEKIYRKKA